MGSFSHPYELCFTGNGMVCDTGECTAYLPAKKKCVVAETTCKRIETHDPCTCCPKVEYVYETTYTEITRPNVIPWWFSEVGAGNIYLNEDGTPWVPEGREVACVKCRPKG
jgi:hypothetical protein